MKSELEKIPGVGPNMAEHLHALGFDTVKSLRGQDPQALYQRDCARCGGILDRCVLYVYRCAVYFAETPIPEPEKCKCWNWKDKPNQKEGAC